MPSIAILGAGPAGLTLARLLQVKCRSESITGLDVTIFEKDVSAHARFDQGGTLDLHNETGIAALKAAGLWDAILPRMRYDGEELCVADMRATEFIRMKSAKQVDPLTSSERPEVDREVLKEVLLKAVLEGGGEGAVTWNKQLVRVEGTTGKLVFKDGTEAGPFDLVVGADGAWSKVRAVVCPDVKPGYSGVVGLIACMDEAHSGKYWPAIEEMVGNGSYFAYSEGRSVTAQRMGDRSMKVSVWTTRKEESWAADVVQQAGGDGDRIRQAMLNEIEDWDNKFKMLVKVSYDYRPWPLYELPVGHRWEHKKGFTLMGDAAHLMTPFAGEGVNMAMKDALDLSERVIASLKDSTISLDDAVQRFEQDMFPRTAKVQEITARNKECMFLKPNAPVELMAKAVDMVAEDAGYDASTGLLSLAVLPVRAMLYAYFWSVSRYGMLKRYLRRPTVIN